jgi:hypothetical protein
MENLKGKYESENVGTDEENTKMDYNETMGASDLG